MAKLIAESDIDDGGDGSKIDFNKICINQGIPVSVNLQLTFIKL